jgi:hypothetical protein
MHAYQCNLVAVNHCMGASFDIKFSEFYARKTGDDICWAV